MMPQPPPSSDSDRLAFYMGLTICTAVLVGLGVEGYMAITSTAIPDQFDRLVNLLAGGLLGFVVRGAVHKDPPPPLLPPDPPLEEE